METQCVLWMAKSEYFKISFWSNLWFKWYVTAKQMCISFPLRPIPSAIQSFLHHLQIFIKRTTQREQTDLFFQYLSWWAFLRPCVATTRETKVPSRRPGCRPSPPPNFPLSLSLSLSLSLFTLQMFKIFTSLFWISVRATWRIAKHGWPRLCQRTGNRKDVLFWCIRTNDAVFQNNTSSKHLVLWYFVLWLHKCKRQIFNVLFYCNLH
jgi:hypothetical protein